MDEKAHKHKLKSAIAIAFITTCVCTVLIGIGVSPLWAVQPGVVPETGLLEHYITVEVEGTIIHYQKQSFWNESEFLAIFENKEEFKNAVIQDFDEKMYHEWEEYAVGADVEFDETKKATVLKCDIHGAIRESDGEYYATFKWLLVPFGLDFIDDNFEESKEGLSWDGEVAGIPTNIIVKLPPQESVYAAWERLPSPGHCHGHVWWTMPVPLPSLVITPTPPGFEAIFAIAGILAMVYLLRKRE
jgi:hypothetical protein